MLGPVAALIAGIILILLVPRLLNYIVAISPSVSWDSSALAACTPDMAR